MRWWCESRNIKNKQALIAECMNGGALRTWAFYCFLAKPCLYSRWWGWGPLKAVIKLGQRSRPEYGTQSLCCSTWWINRIMRCCRWHLQRTCVEDRACQCRLTSAKHDCIHLHIVWSVHYCTIHVSRTECVCEQWLPGDKIAAIAQDCI